MLSVMIVDDQPRELDGIRSILHWDELDINVAHTAQSASEALTYAKEHAVDIVITDVMMPDMDGLALVEALHELSPFIKVICISCFDDYKFVSGAVNRGACGFLLKPILSGEMKMLLKRVIDDIRRERVSVQARQEAQGTDMDAHEAVKRMIANIEAHYHEELTMDAIVEGVYLSRGYAGTLFKNETGLTTHQYILELRLKKAAEMLLADRDAKIYDIAWQCGFADASHLINAFRQKYRITPMQYRKRGGLS